MLSRALGLGGLCIPALGGTLAAAPVQDDEESEPYEFTKLREALEAGRVWLNFRYRYEYTDRDDFSRSATANTLRTALGYESGSIFGNKFLIEFEDVTDITDDYNSTTNGNTQYPVIADPDGTEVNQVYWTMDGMDENTFRLGRQEITIDNQRFVGPVPWRQNHQSYDALSWRNISFPNTVLYAAYVNRVNRIFGEESPVGDVDTSTFLLNGGTDVEGFGKLTGYWYYLDNDDETIPSSSTFGARFTGRRPWNERFDLVYAVEFAQQTDTGDNPADLDEKYWLGEIGLGFNGFTLKGAWEHLGGSGGPGESFQTPLATLHLFNGLADQFLTTPDTGLEDWYIKLTGGPNKIDFYGAFHYFESDTGGLTYGYEWDFGVVYRPIPQSTWGASFNYFDGDEGGFVDVTNIYAYVELAPL